MRNIPTDVRFNPITNISNSLTTKQTVSFTAPPGYDFRDFFFQLLGGLTVAMIEEVRLMANGGIIQRYNGTDLNLINLFFNTPAYNTYTTPILFMPQRRLGVRGGVQSFDKTALALTTGSSKDLAIESTLNAGSYDAQGRGIASVQFEFDINNTPGAGALQIVPRAQVCDPYPGGPGLLKVVDKFTFNALIGTNTITKNTGLKHGDLLHSMLDALVIIPPTANLSDFVMRYNNNEIRRRSSDENLMIQRQDNLRSPQAGMWVIDMLEHGYGDEALLIGPTATNLELDFTSDAAEGITIYQISLGYLFAQ